MHVELSLKIENNFQMVLQNFNCIHRGKAQYFNAMKKKECYAALGWIRNKLASFPQM